MVQDPSAKDAAALQAPVPGTGYPGYGRTTPLPSKDPVTGRRLSGAAQARLKAERAQPQTRTRTRVKDAVPLAGGLWASVPDPPLSEGVVAVSVWVSTRVLPVAVQYAERGADITRARTITAMCSRLGKMRDKSTRCEQALTVREDRQGQAVNVLSPDPPVGDPIACLPWAYFRLASSIHDATRDEHFSRDRYLSVSETCSAMGMVPPNAAIDALIEALAPKGS